MTGQNGTIDRLVALDGERLMPFGEFLEVKAHVNQDQVYMYFQDEQVTYAQLADRVKRVANALGDMGVKRGEKIALVVHNCPEFIYAWYAAMCLGACTVPVNAALKGEGLAYIINQSDSETLIFHHRYTDNLGFIRADLKNVKRKVVTLNEAPDEYRMPEECTPFDELYQGACNVPAVDVKPDDMVMILYTSGTTGLPKGTVRRYENTERYIVQVLERYAEHAWEYKASDVPYVFLPLFHVLAQMNSRTTLAANAKMALTERFSASRFWDEVRRYGCTRFTYTGGVLPILCKRPEEEDDADNPVQYAFGFGTPAGIWDPFEKRFDLTIIETYGTSDGGVGTRYTPGDKKGCIGKANELMHVRIVDENDNDVAVGQVGEIIWKPRDESTPLTLEYYKKPKETAAKTRGGWLRSGDYAYRDEQGNYYFVDRQRQFIRRRGENISSFEVERVVDKHPSVLESAAVGVRSELGEEDVKICVVLKPDHSLRAEEFIAFCEDRMAYFMVPRYVEFKEALPKTGTERVQKFLLKEEGITPNTWDREKAGYKLKR